MTTRKTAQPVVQPDVAANIRAIFLHNGEPVAVDHAAALLGWDLPTMDAAIKWKVVQLDDSSPTGPQITRLELLEQALEQWTLREIAGALGRKNADRVLGRKYSRCPGLVVRDRDTAYAAAVATLDTPPPSVLLLPHARAELRIRLEKALAAAGRAARQHRRRRPYRTDGVRESTLTAAEVSPGHLVPVLRLRGRWLAALGFRPRMRVYVVAEAGKLVMTVADPAANREPVAVPRLQLVSRPS